MTIIDLFNVLQNKDDSVYIVILKYKYHENDTENDTEYVIDNQVLYRHYSSRTKYNFSWLYDWNEGYEDIEVVD